MKRNPTHKEAKHTSRIMTYICPLCNKFELVNVDQICIYDHGDKTEVRYHPQGAIDVFCKECDNNPMFYCDPKMVDPVIKIGNKGYVTMGCCEGHHKDFEPDQLLPGGGDSENPYLSFVAPVSMVEELVRIFCSVNTSGNFICIGEYKFLMNDDVEGQCVGVRCFLTDEAKQKGSKFLDEKSEFFTVLNKFVEAMPECPEIDGRSFRDRYWGDDMDPFEQTYYR